MTRSAALRLPPTPPAGARIGILGGSFNPAHDGHRHITDCAFDLLGLDQVWWLVSPQNPLKSPEGMATVDDRLGSCIALVGDRTDIVPTDIEMELGTRKTAETLVRIVERFPEQHFVWLMGADNLIQVARWTDWQQIFHTVPIAVFARPTYSSKALSSKAARDFTGSRIETAQATELVAMEPPAWVYLDIDPHPGSATKIRAGQV
ncbi:MAG: nicotinate-nucleotide adenylyltransferase [Rhodospirillales bacterium]